MSPRARAWRERTQERRWQPCDITGCEGMVHGLSRWCNRHATHAGRYGSPTARVVLRTHVKSFEAIARRLIRVNRRHDAIKLVCASLDQLLSSAAILDHGRPAVLKRADVDGRVNRELARLHSRGVTGRTILTLCLALHFYARNSPGVLGLTWLGSRRHRFAIARHVLHFKERGRRGHTAPSARVLDRCGERLIQVTDQLLTALESAFARQQSAAQGSTS